MHSGRVSCDDLSFYKRKNKFRAKRAASQEIRINKPKGRASLSSVSTAANSVTDLKPPVTKIQGIKLSKNVWICFDEGVQRYYFKARNTQEKLWKLPKKDELKKFLLMDKNILEMQEWQIAFEYNIKRYYFYNLETERSHWVLPIHEPLLKRHERKLLSTLVYTKYIRRSIAGVSSESDNGSDSDSVFSSEEPEDELQDSSVKSIASNKELFEKETKLHQIRSYHSASILDEMKSVAQSRYRVTSEDDNESSWSLSDSDD